MKDCIRLLVLLLALLGCSVAGMAGWMESARKQVGKGNLAKAREIVLKRLTKHPFDGEAQRELGVLWYQDSEIDSAELRLRRADELRPADERTLLFLGMTLERKDQPAAAIEVYQSLDSPLLRARLELVSDVELRKAIGRALEAESNLKKLGITVSQQDSTLATMEFATRTMPDSLRPLGRGLSALLSSDLAQLTPYHVLERTRLQPLFDELMLRNIGMTDASDSNSAIGKLAGVTLLCTGQLTLDENSLQANAHLVAVPNGESQFAGDAQGILKAYYLVEKALLSQLLEALGVTLGAQDEKWLASIPTESLPAFLAYSQGLELWDQGHREAALLAFQRATDLDPLFGLAATEREWRAAASSAGSDDSKWIELSNEKTPTSITEPAPSDPSDVQFTLRDLIGSTNPNAIEKPGAVGEGTKTDPRDIPFADQFGPWINISVRPYRP